MKQAILKNDEPVQGKKQTQGLRFTPPAYGLPFIDSNTTQRKASADISLENKSLPVQRMLIPAVEDDEHDLDTDQIDFATLVRQLAIEGNIKRLLYFVKYITAHAEGAEKIHLLNIITTEAGKLMPKDQEQGIHIKVNQLTHVLRPEELQQLVALLQRDTLNRTRQLFELHDLTHARQLIRTWQTQEQQVKATPVSGGWGNTVSLAQPLLNLINSILKHGILSPAEAGRRGLKPVGSMDTGLITGISVNTFATVDRELTTARRLAADSMGMIDRGSISVSTERTNDTLLSQLPKWQDIQLDPREVESAQREFGELAHIRIKILKESRAIQRYEEALNGPLKHILNTRAKGTIMAVLDKATTGVSSTNVDRHTAQPTEDSSQEVRMQRPQIRTGHILELLVPDFIRPYFDLIVNPADIPIQFVDVTRVDAHYKTGNGQLKLQNVVAPDYVEGIARQLQQHGVVSTHIITTNENRFAVPPDFDEEAVTRELEQLADEGAFDEINDSL